ncbi:hypothetical protein KJF94_16050 [Pseudomonas hormoni]|uniref:Tail assembly protein n=1 Tax=Pseudomonas hormoni TaxID=3093767 RepID=A0ABX8ERN7_9PSED|nr:hypothetical protein [Pseudomonas hormoni]QVW21425.1 hypothetical protein KJF94_16050 [Pseudomonas hormoni]
MGFLKKAFKQVVKIASNPLGGGDDDKKAPEVAAPAAPTPAPAAVVEAPKADDKADDDADTEAAKRAAKAKGKRGLSVARSSGTGLNI